MFCVKYVFQMERWLCVSNIRRSSTSMLTIQIKGAFETREVACDHARHLNATSQWGRNAPNNENHLVQGPVYVIPSP